MARHERAIQVRAMPRMMDILWNILDRFPKQAGKPRPASVCAIEAGTVMPGIGYCYAGGRVLLCRGWVLSRRGLAWLAPWPPNLPFPFGVFMYSPTH